MISDLCICVCVCIYMGFPCGSVGKESACNVETWVLSLGREDPLEEGMATHSSNLACRVPTDRGDGRAAVRGVTESRTRLSTHSTRSGILLSRQRDMDGPGDHRTA